MPRCAPLSLFTLSKGTHADETRAPQNVIAVYIGTGVYVVCYVGYTLYEYLWLKKRHHLVPLREVDLDTDAVWGPGEGARVREKEALAREERDAADVANGRRVRVFMRKVGRVVG